MIMNGSQAVFVGRQGDAAVQQARTDGAEIVSLNNGVIVPGIIDSHVHLLMLASLCKSSTWHTAPHQNNRHTIGKHACKNSGSTPYFMHAVTVRFVLLPGCHMTQRIGFCRTLT